MDDVPSFKPLRDRYDTHPDGNTSRVPSRYDAGPGYGGVTRSPKTKGNLIDDWLTSSVNPVLNYARSLEKQGYSEAAARIEAFRKFDIPLESSGGRLGFRMPPPVIGDGHEDFSYTDLFSDGKGVILSTITASRVEQVTKRLHTVIPEFTWVKRIYRLCKPGIIRCLK